MANVIVRNLGRIVLGLLSLAPLAAAAAPPPAAAPTKRLVLAIFPPVGLPVGTSGESPALLMQAYAAELLEATGRYNEIHIKQILRFMARENVKEPLDSKDFTAQTGHRLGADRVVSGSLVQRSGGYELVVSARGLSYHDGAAPGVKQESAALRGGMLAVVRQGGALLARKVAELDGITIPKSREPSVVSARSEQALADFSRCYSGILPQPIRPGAPVLDTNPEFHAKLLSVCESAVQADPNYDAAWAALALERAQSLTLASYQPSAQPDCPSQQQKVLADLSHVHLDKGYFPLAYLTRYWLNSRCVDPGNKDLVAPLEEAIAQHPGMLIAYGYLAEHWAYTGQYDQALAAWDSYAQQNPFSAFVKGRRSHALANLPTPRHADAIAAAQEAYDLDKENTEAALELASRYIDARQLDQAIERLTPIAARQSASIAANKTAGLIAEVHVRLAYALEQKASRDRKPASALLTQAAAALDQAEKIGIEDWRTNLKLLLNRAIIQVELGHREEAERLLRHRLETDPQFKSYLIRWVGRDRELSGRIRIEGQANLLPSTGPTGAPVPPTEVRTKKPGDEPRRVGIVIFPASPNANATPDSPANQIPSSADRNWLPPPAPVFTIRF